MNDAVRGLTAAIAGVILALIAPDLRAKVEAPTLAELVRQSSAILVGRVQASGLTKTPGQWAPFTSSQVFKGDAALADKTIQLCNSPSPNGEYPKLSLLTYDVVLFLVETKAGCFEFSYTTKSVLEVHGGKVITAPLADQPLEQSWDEFAGKLRKTVANEATSSR